MAASYDITIDQGATFSFTFTFKDANDDRVDLTDYAAKMQIREYHSSASPVLTLTTEDDSIELGGVLGTVKITMSSEVTRDIFIDSGVYDIELYSPIFTTIRMLQGKITVSPEVTRD
jgi:hypothetical protein